MEDTYQDPGGPGGMPLSRVGIVSLSVYLLVVTVSLIGGLVILWPSSEEFFTTIKLPPSEIRMLLLSLVAGALGGSLGALNAVTWFVGNRNLYVSWALKYIMQPIVGGIIGLFLYVAIRGGILKAGTDVDALNPYTIVPIIWLAGLFSTQVLLKLKDLAESRLSRARPTPGRADSRRDVKKL